MLTQDHQRRSSLQEKRKSKLTGGFRTPGSGNGWIKKGDVRTIDELYELKTTLKSSFRLDASYLRKFWNEALIDDKIPVMEIEFASDGPMTCVVLDVNEYDTMKEELMFLREVTGR